MTDFITRMTRMKRHTTSTRAMKLRCEQLERRDLMTATPFDASAALSNAVCGCPICTGQGLAEQIDATPAAHATASGTSAAVAVAVTTKYALSSLPQLSSSPGSKAKLVLDFDGNSLSSWGTKTNVVTSAYDIDGDTKTFSTQELANIREIWARVAEDYAPFNIDVTTVDPGVLTDKVVAKIAIGGSASDWYGANAGGVAYIGGFYNTAPNIGFVFENNLSNGNPKIVADATSHEAGHLFGLSHQAKWNGTTLVSEYNPGDANWAPIMGVAYYSAVTTWTLGPKSIASDLIQDDMAVIAGASNGIGYRINKQGSMGTAVSLGTGNTFSASGVIAQNTDQQWWKFTTGGGSVSINVNTIAVGANLDSVLEIRNSAGNVLYTADSSATLNSSLKVTLASGTYYAVVRSTGEYGYVGQYTLTGTVTPPAIASATAPEVTLLLGTTGVGDGGSVAFGTTKVGTAVDKTFTIRNDGNATLTLQAINPSSLPAGFALVSNIGSTTLQAGQTTTFTIRLTAAAAGNFWGWIRFYSNDANEATYDIDVTGTVTAPVAPEVTLLLGSTGVADSSTVAFGTTNVGDAVDKTFTIRNDGNATLTLQAINPSSLPAGFALVSNIGSTTLQAGQTTTFTIRLTAAAAGNFWGWIRFYSNDADEATYDISVTGTVTAPAASKATLLLGSTSVADSGTVAFGTTNVGTAVDKTFTIRNDGNAALTLQAINPSGLPTGFSLVSNIGSTTLQAGATTTFTVRMTATATGSFSGVVRFNSNDASRATYDINVTGTVKPLPAPEITVLQGGSSVANGGSAAFGTTTAGKAIDKTFTIRNDGNATLTLQAISWWNVPAGFSLVSNIGSTSLEAGKTTTFTVRMTAAAVGSYSGVVRFATNDSNKPVFYFTATGVVTAPPAPEVTLLLGTTSVADGGSVAFGTTTTGTAVNKTFTIRNDGNAALTLQAINPSSLPAGFAIVSNIGATTLPAGQTTTFTIRLTATAAGNYSGVIRFNSNDANEAVYDINVSGVVKAPLTTKPPSSGAVGPEVTVLDGRTEIISWTTQVSFGQINVGAFVDKTITIRNDGDTPLELQPIDTAKLPAWLAIVSNLRVSSLTAGASTSFTVRFSPKAAGGAYGTIPIRSNDADESNFVVQFIGTATAAPQAPSLAQSVALIDEVMSQFDSKRG